MIIIFVNKKIVSSKKSWINANDNDNDDDPFFSSFVSFHPFDPHHFFFVCLFIFIVNRIQPEFSSCVDMSGSVQLIVIPAEKKEISW